jgi:PAS domain S-box-containing protein
MDTIVKIGTIRPCTLDQMLRGELFDSSAIKTSSWDWMFRVLKVAVEHTTEGIIVLDSAGIIRFANEVSARAHGYASRTNLLGKDLSALHSHQQMTEHVTPFVNEARHLGRFEGPLNHLRRDGTVFSADTKMTVIKNEAGDDIGLIVFHRDTAELDEAKAALADATEQLNKELAQRNLLDARLATQNQQPAAFSRRLARATDNRYGSDDGQARGGKVAVPVQPADAQHGTDVSNADSPHEIEAGHDASDPYLELRKASGGPLDTNKLADLAELLKRLS